MTGDLASHDTRSVVRSMCPRCSVRLCVDDLGLCLHCHDRQAMGRQSTLSQSRFS